MLTASYSEDCCAQIAIKGSRSGRERNCQQCIVGGRGGAEVREVRNVALTCCFCTFAVRCGGAASAKSPRLRPLPQSPSSEPRAGMGMDVDVGGQVVRENGPRRSV